MKHLSHVAALVAILAVALCCCAPARAQWVVVGAYTDDPTDYPYSPITPASPGVGYYDESGPISPGSTPPFTADGASAEAWNSGGFGVVCPSGSTSDICYTPAITCGYYSHVVFGYEGSGYGNPDNPLAGANVMASAEETNTCSSSGVGGYASVTDSWQFYIGSTLEWGGGSLDASDIENSGTFELSLTPITSDLTVSTDYLKWLTNGSAFSTYGSASLDVEMSLTVNCE